MFAARYLLLLFFIFGWAYYMVATILMKGSIFEAMRGVIARKAEEGSWFLSKIQEMLGCLMCTATEAALWTLGISTFFLAFRYGFASHIISSAVGTRVALGAFTELILDCAFAFALSLAVAGEAWAIKTVVEHRERQFLALREEFRAREIELIEQIRSLESGGKSDFTFDLS